MVLLQAFRSMWRFATIAWLLCVRTRTDHSIRPLCYALLCKALSVVHDALGFGVAITAAVLGADVIQDSELDNAAAAASGIGLLLRIVAEPLVGDVFSYDVAEEVQSTVTAMVARVIRDANAAAAAAGFGKSVTGSVALDRMRQRAALGILVRDACLFDFVAVLP